MRRAAVLAIAVSLLGSGCAPHVIIATGTTLGIKATPGDGQTRPPQVVLGYKRAEAAVIPVEGGGAQMKDKEVEKDAASTVASFYLKSQWTDATEIRSFIGSGFAARNIVKDEVFATNFAVAATPRLSTETKARQKHLADLLGRLDETKATAILDTADLKLKPGRNAVQSLRVHIVDAKTKAALDTLESAFAVEGIE